MSSFLAVTSVVNASAGDLATNDYSSVRAQKRVAMTNLTIGSIKGIYSNPAFAIT